MVVLGGRAVSLIFSLFLSVPLGLLFGFLSGKLNQVLFLLLRPLQPLLQRRVIHVQAHSLFVRLDRPIVVLGIEKGVTEGTLIGSLIWLQLGSFPVGLQ